MTLISVIIPAYNAGKTIKATIESVLNQTFSDFEIIIINDGSTDSTLEIIEHIPDHRIKVLSYPNSGPQKSRNRGISEASGEYLAFLDADDIWTPDKLESQLNALVENPEAAVAYSWTNWVNETGEVWRRGTYISAAGNVYEQLLLIDFVGSGSNPLIRRQALASVGDFDESLVGGQDWDMWLRLAALYPFAVVPLPQILYRKSPDSNSWSNNVERQEIGFNRVIEKALFQAPESIQQRKKDIIANRYKCLVVDALERPSGQRRALTAARFLWTAIKNDPSLIRAKVLVKVVLRIAIMALLPPQKAQELLTKLGKLSDIQAFYGYLQLEPRSR